jgi:hypothetical protein
VLPQKHFLWLAQSISFSWRKAYLIGNIVIQSIKKSSKSMMASYFSAKNVYKVYKNATKGINMGEAP